METFSGLLGGRRASYLGSAILDARLAQVLAAVRAAGGRLYEVGGSVRDRTMGIVPKDRDLLVTGVPMEVLIAVLPGTKDLVGASFGVIKCQVDGEVFDIALPRTEQRTGQGHQDFAVTTDHTLPVESDLARRDFTMNAVAIDLDSGEVIDPFGGREDIARRVIRAVGNPEDRFSEDPLRMLRGLRFAARLGFDVGQKTLVAMARSADQIERVAPERIQGELAGLLKSTNGASVKKALRLLEATGLLVRIFPEFEPSIGFDQRNRHHHETVDAHVLSVVENAVDFGGSLRVRWAALFHDVAKPRNFVVDEAGAGHFYEHEDAGADMTRAICDRLKFSVDDTNAIVQLVREHDALEMEPSDRTIRRFVARLGDNWLDAVILRAADRAAHVGQSVEACRTWATRTIPQRVAEVGAGAVGFTVAKLALRGDVLTRGFGLKGKAIGAAKAKMAAAVIDGLVPNEPEALARWLRAQTD